MDYILETKTFNHMLSVSQKSPYIKEIGIKIIKQLHAHVGSS